MSEKDIGVKKGRKQHDLNTPLSVGYCRSERHHRAYCPMACLAFHSYWLPSTWKRVNIAWLKCLKLLRGEYCLKSVVMSPQRCWASVQERAGVRARLLRYSVITANISSILAHLPVSLSPTPVRSRHGAVSAPWRDGEVEPGVPSLHWVFIFMNEAENLAS